MSRAFVALLLLGACRTPPLDLENDGGMITDNASYAARLLPTALNRLLITKTDPARDLCFAITLVNPMDSNAFGITLPAKWAVQDARGSRPSTSCGVFMGPPTAVAATNGTGTITFDGANPCTVTLSGSLRFPANNANVPTQEALSAPSVKVSDNGSCK